MLGETPPEEPTFSELFCAGTAGGEGWIWGAPKEVFH
jgi:hypothetical protein